MKEINEEFNTGLSFSDKIYKIKKNNPGKFDHLPDPKLVNPLSSWSLEKILDFERELKYKLKVEDSKNT